LPVHIRVCLLKNLWNSYVKPGRNSNIICWNVTPCSLVIFFYVHLSTSTFTLYKHPYCILLVSSLLCTIQSLIICLSSVSLEERICGSLLRFPRADNIYNLKMTAVSSSETVENFYQIKRCHIPESCNLPSHRCYNFKEQR
jgi:hypothetical protein